MSVTIQTSILKRIRATLQPTPLTAALRNSEKTTKETKEETNGRTSEQTIKETDEKAYEGPSEEELSWFAEDSNSEGERGYKAYVDERDRMGNEFKGFEAYMQDQPNLKWNKNIDPNVVNYPKAYMRYKYDAYREYDPKLDAAMEASNIELQGIDPVAISQTTGDAPYAELYIRRPMPEIPGWTMWDIHSARKARTQQQNSGNTASPAEKPVEAQRHASADSQRIKGEISHPPLAEVEEIVSENAQELSKKPLLPLNIDIPPRNAKGILSDAKPRHLSLIAETPREYQFPNGERSKQEYSNLSQYQLAENNTPALDSGMFEHRSSAGEDESGPASMEQTQPHENNKHQRSLTLHSDDSSETVSEKRQKMSLKEFFLANPDPPNQQDLRQLQLMRKTSSRSFLNWRIDASSSKKNHDNSGASIKSTSSRRSIAGSILNFENWIKADHTLRKDRKADSTMDQT